MDELLKGVDYLPAPYCSDYLVGNDGFVFSTKSASSKAKLTKLRADLSGAYPTYTLCKNNKVKRFRANRLVLSTFDPRSNESELLALHIDGNTRNNHISNLYWGDVWDNTADKFRHGTVPCGEKSGNAKLTEVDVLKIRELHDLGKTSRELGELYRVTAENIWCIVTRKTWKHVQ